MFFDSKNFGLVDLAIAMEIAEMIDDGQPKAKLIDSLRRSPRIASRSLATLLNFTTTILGRSAHRADVSETLQVNPQSFDQVSEN